MIKMAINIKDIVIEAPLKPSRIIDGEKRILEDYFVNAYISGIRVGNLMITRAISKEKIQTGTIEDFFFQMTSDGIISKPFVFGQNTEEEFQRQGVNPQVIILANEFYKGKLGTPLYSSTQFVVSAQGAPQKVWKKLVQKGLAVYKPFTNIDYFEKSSKLQPRWAML